MTAAAAATQVLERTTVLASVPAPSFHEQKRSRLVAQWWQSDGIAEVSIDSVGNVRGRLVAGDPALTAIVVCAHLDTVFGEDVRHEVVARDGRLIGPSVGDDCVAVCALSALGTLLPRLRHPVWIAATVGEEGLGNLHGVKELLRWPPAPLGAMIAVEGNYLGRVNVVGVGSIRWEVTVQGPGGHAWEDAERPSAIHAAATLIAELDRLTQVRAPKATVNVGRIQGGESINSRAEHVTFQVDLRSGDPVVLDRLTNAARLLLDRIRPPLTVTLEAIGDRPAGELSTDHPLALAAAEALGTVGITARFTAASTDANAAYALGIPAVTLGITTGAGTHTEQEWIDIAPVASGLTALARTITLLDGMPVIPDDFERKG